MRTGQLVLGFWRMTTGTIPSARPSYCLSLCLGSPRALLAGIVSCLASSADGALLAAGSYCGGVLLLDPRTRELLTLLEGHKGGITQVSEVGRGGRVGEGGGVVRESAGGHLEGH
jgi:hypothetical protein